MSAKAGVCDVQARQVRLAENGASSRDAVVAQRHKARRHAREDLTANAQPERPRPAAIGFAGMSIDLPAWSMRTEAASVHAVQWSGPITREWAWGGASGNGVFVGLVDSG